MSKGTLAIVIAIVVVAVVVLAYYMLKVLPNQKVTSQALTQYSVPASSAPQTPMSIPQTEATQPIIGVPFFIHSGSYLAKFANIPVNVVSNPIFVGDSVWLIIELPTGNYITEVIDVVSAEAMGVGSTIVYGTTLTPIVV